MRALFSDLVCFQPSFFCVFSTKNVSFNKTRMLTRFFNCYFLDDIFIVKMHYRLVYDPKRGEITDSFGCFLQQNTEFQLLFETLLRMNWKFIDFLKFLPKQFTGRQTFLFYRNIPFWCVFVKHFLRFPTILFQKNKLRMMSDRFNGFPKMKKVKSG